MTASLGEDILPRSMVELDLPRKLATEVARTGEPVIISDLRAWLDDEPGLAAPAGQIRGSFLGVPVTALGGATAGAIAALALEPRQWQASDLHALRDVAALTSDRFEPRTAEPVSSKRSHRPDPAREAPADVLCKLNPSGQIIEVGVRALDVWGFQPPELVGKCIMDLLVPAEVADAELSLQQAKLDGSSADMTSTCVHKNGKLHTVYWTARWSAEERCFYAISRNERPAPLPSASTDTRDQRILVVDDYREIGLLVRTALQFADFNNILIASSPVRAIDIAQEQPVDLVIADLRMEPLNGVELFHRLRRMPRMHDIPFIIISGYLSPAIIENLKQAGVTSFLAKPFRANDVVRHVLAALERQNGAAA